MGYYSLGRNYLKIKTFKIDTFFFEGLLLVSIFYFFIDFFLLTNSIYIQFDTISFYRNMLTNEMESHKLPFIFLTYSGFYTLVYYLVYFWSKLNYRKYLYAFLLIYFAILSSGRSTMVITILIILIHFLSRLSFFKRLILGLSFCFIGFFLFNLYGEVIGKVGEGFGILNYFTAPSKALNQIFYYDPILLRPGYKLTFLPIRTFIDPVNYFPIVPYIMSPVVVNAFTLVGVFLNDFGKLGSLLSFFLIGILVRIINNKAKNKKQFGNNLSLTILSVMLLLSCFHDYLTTSIALLVIVFVFQFIELNNLEYVRN